MGGQDASSAHSFLVVLAAVLVSNGHTDFFSGKSVFLRGGTYATNRGGLSARVALFALYLIGLVSVIATNKLERFWPSVFDSLGLIMFQT